MPFPMPTFLKTIGGFFRKMRFEYMRPRTIRMVFTLLNAFALILCLHNAVRLITHPTGNDQNAWHAISGANDRLLITDVVEGSVADVAGIRDNDTLLAINGHKFKTINQAQLMIDSVPGGSYAMYTVSRQGHIIETPVQILKLFDIRTLSLFLFGLGFLVVGYVVVMTRPQGKIQQMFSLYAIGAMLIFGLYTNIDVKVLGLPVTIAYLAALLFARIMAPPIFILFFYYFPVRSAMLLKRWMRPMLYTISILVIIPITNIFNLGTMPFIGVIAAAPIFFFIYGLSIFARAYFLRIEKSKRGPLRHILIAAVVDAVVFIYMGLIAAIRPFLFVLYPVSLLPLILIIGLPLAFGYSIFRYRLMDIDLIVKRSLIYGAITATIAAVYLLVVMGAGQLTGLLFGRASSQTLNIVAIVVIAFIFDPLKRRVQEWIDRYFYRERYNYQKALLEFSSDLPRQMNMEQILQSMINTISSAMHVEKVGIVVCDESEGCLSVSRNIPRELETYANRPGGLLALLRTTQKAQSLGLLGEETDAIPIDAEDKRTILSSGIVLSVPMLLKERLIGTINVGPKLSGKIYSQEDIDLLATVASQAAIAIENSRLHRAEVEKQRMEEELDIARRIQQGLLPKSNPVITGLDISGISIPALSVGGDYYDYIHLDDGRLLVVVADVSGKGMSAALYMSKIQGMIQLAAHMYHSPREMLVEVNRRIYDGIERKSFITMILGLFDLERKEMILCRAGHNKALIGVNGDLRYAEAAGIGLGLEPGPLFDRQLEEVRQPLEPGRLFVFYSDGLTEAMNDRKDQFGEEKVFDIVRQCRALSACQMQQNILRQVEQFRGSAEVHDDITLVIVKTTPN